MLKNFVKGIADAIRRKEGSSDLISPMDFAQRIDDLTVGGGTVESSIEYLDVSGGDFVEHPESKAGFIFVSSAIRIKGESYLNIIPSAYLITAQDGFLIADVKAFKIDMNEMFLLTNAEPTTIKEELEKSYGKEYLASIPRITKEQFYSLE
jgi:hypothetical protein